MIFNKAPVKDDIPFERFWAKKSGKHGSGKFHFWPTDKSSLCGGSPGHPTSNRRLYVPYLSCQRCLSLLPDFEALDSKSQSGDSDV